MYVEVGRHLSVNLLEEVEKLGGAMPLVAFADDNVRLNRDRLAPSNAALVRRAVEIAERHDRSVATWQQARQILGLRMPLNAGGARPPGKIGGSPGSGEFLQALAGPERAAR